ncbi:MAG: outer membrane beta-barrel protein [Rhodospirillales bacterium]
MPLTKNRKTLLAAGFFAVAGVAFSVLPSTADAQYLERGRGVIDRPRPELDPLGVPVGGFLLFPQLTVGEEWNSNIFAQDDGLETDDFITHVQPSLNLISQWSRHGARAFFQGDFAFYADNDGENYEDLAAGFNGRLDVVGDSSRPESFLRGGFTYRRQHEERGSPDDVFGLEPTIYNVLSPTVGGVARFGRFGVSLDGTLNRFDFDDTEVAGGLRVNQDDRDRNEWLLALQTSYQIQQEYEAFIRLTLNKRDYDDRFDDIGFERSSDGYEIIGGAQVDLTGLIFGDFFFGWRSQSYDDTRLTDIDGPTYGMGLTWNVTQLTSARFRISRTIEETTLGGASGYFATDMRANVDHELLRNLILSANAGYAKNDYEGISREDDFYRFGISGKYLLNRYLYVTLGYGYEVRDSNVAGQDYDRNTVLLRLQGQL